MYLEWAIILVTYNGAYINSTVLCHWAGIGVNRPWLSYTWILAYENAGELKKFKFEDALLSPNMHQIPPQVADFDENVACQGHFLKNMANLHMSLILTWGSGLTFLIMLSDWPKQLFYFENHSIMECVLLSIVTNWKRMPTAWPSPF